MPYGTGEETTGRTDRVAPESVAFAAEGGSLAMPVRRPGALARRTRAASAGSASGIGEDQAAPPPSSLKRVLDGLRNLS